MQNRKMLKKYQFGEKSRFFLWTFEVGIVIIIEYVCGEKPLNIVPILKWRSLNAQENQ